MAVILTSSLHCLWKGATRNCYLCTSVTLTSSALVATSLWFLKVDYIHPRSWHGQHPDDKLHKCEESSITHKHTPTNIVSMSWRQKLCMCLWPKCCWQVKIDPTLLFSLPLPFRLAHFFLPLSSPSHLFPSFIQPCFLFLLVHFILIVSSRSLSLYPAMPCIPLVYVVRLLPSWCLHHCHH